MTEIILADVARPPKFVTTPDLDKVPFVRVVLGNIADPTFCGSLLDGADAVSIFHLGAVMSGQGEADFDLCMSVNLMGTMNMLAAARNCAAPRPRFILASAGATLGAGDPTDFVTVGTQDPQPNLGAGSKLLKRVWAPRA